MVEELDWETTLSCENSSKDNLYMEQFPPVYGTSSKPWERTAGVQKGKSIYLRWGRAKDKDKNGDRGFGDSILRRGSWRRSFQATGSPLTSGVIGELRNLRWKHNNAKRRKFCAEVVPNGNFQPKGSSHTQVGWPWGHIHSRAVSDRGVTSTAEPWVIPGVSATAEPWVIPGVSATAEREWSRITTHVFLEPWVAQISQPAVS